MQITQSISGHLTPFAFETLTIDATAGGIGLTADKRDGKPATDLNNRDQGHARLVTMTTESQQLRYTFDGTAPVGGTTGHLADVGTPIDLSNYQAMKNFRAIREGANSAKIQVTYWR